MRHEGRSGFPDDPGNPGSEGPKTEGDGPGRDTGSRTFSVEALQEFPGVRRFLNALYLVAALSGVPGNPAEAGSRDFSRSVLSKLESGGKRAVGYGINGLMRIPERKVRDVFRDLENRQREKKTVTERMIRETRRFETDVAMGIHELRSLRDEYGRAIRERRDLKEAGDVSVTGKGESSLRRRYLMRVERLRRAHDGRVNRIIGLVGEIRYVFHDSEKMLRHLDRYIAHMSGLTTRFHAEADATYEHIMGMSLEVGASERGKAGGSRPIGDDGVPEHEKVAPGGLFDAF